MRIRHLLFSTTLVTTSLLAGCAFTQTSAEPEPIPPLDSQTFENRIDQLEQRLADRCDLQQAAFEDHTEQARSLFTEVREVGSQVRHLRADVKRLGEEPAVVTAQCDEAEDSLLHNKEVLGRSEWIGLPDVGTYLKARIDTGANTSSLSAKEITRFERDGENWVRFKLALTEDDVAVEQVLDQWIEAPVVRRVRITQAAGNHSRPVVSLLMTLGPIREQVEFTLNDRTHLNYPVLLGRRFMMDIAIIDVAQRYIHSRPEFPGGAPSDQASKDEVGDDEDDTAETSE
ncbi:ATP-dependent zinc protease [Litchfieldella qijiaojingensis]|nr:ATP-dependent zinc protease [Halomonas qijiaojingensis]